MMIIACTICLETFLSTPFLSPLLFFLVFAFSFLIFILCLFLVSCLSAVLHAFTLWKIALWKKASVFKFSENNTTVVQPLWIISCCCKGWFFYFSLVWSYECMRAELSGEPAIYLYPQSGQWLVNTSNLLKYQTLLILYLEEKQKQGYICFFKTVTYMCDISYTMTNFPIWRQFLERDIRNWKIFYRRKLRLREISGLTKETKKKGDSKGQTTIYLIATPAQSPGSYTDDMW